DYDEDVNSSSENEESFNDNEADDSDDVLRDAIINPNQWSFEQFIETDAWKPDKDNKAFSDLWNECKGNMIVGFQKLKLTKGEKMEFADVAKELEKELDLYHYFKKTIIGLCARFIIYHKKYEPQPSSRIMQIEDPDEKYKQIDDYAQNKAKSWLERFVKENIIVNGVTSKMMESRGIAYKRAVKKVQEMLYQKISTYTKYFMANGLATRFL
ncbi:hypothetical protein C1646_766510, partial [Rhizophagus diaphanus]